MAIMHSCCFWKSVRKGSYASAIYTLVYFGCSCTIASIYLFEEQKYLTGEVDKPTGESFLEKEAISPTTVIFNILLLICASCGFISSILVIIALKKNQRELLIPWILFMITDLIIECSHFIYLVMIKTLDFEPLTATLFTIDFFIICLNIYCVLCVISQYQEYKAGRGYADSRHRPTSEISGPSSTSGACLNTFRYNQNTRTFSTYPRSSFTKIGTTPLSPPTSSSISKRHQHHGRSSVRKKHVQFPDDDDNNHTSFVSPCHNHLKIAESKDANDVVKALINIEASDNKETTLS